MAPKIEVLWVDHFVTGQSLGIRGVPDDTDTAGLSDDPLDIEDSDLAAQVNSFSNYSASYKEDVEGCSTRVVYTHYPEGPGQYFGETPFNQFAQCRLPDGSTDKYYVDTHEVRRIVTNDDDETYVRLDYQRPTTSGYPNRNHLTRGTISFNNGGRVEYDAEKKRVVVYDSAGEKVASLPGAIEVIYSKNSAAIVAIRNVRTVSPDWVSGGYTYFTSHLWGSVDSVNQLFERPEDLIPATDKGRWDAIANYQTSGVTVSPEPISFNLVDDDRQPYPFQHSIAIHKDHLTTNANYYIVDDLGNRHLLLLGANFNVFGEKDLFTFDDGSFEYSPERSYRLVAEVDSGWRFGNERDPQRMAAEITVYPLEKTDIDVTTSPLPLKTNIPLPPRFYNEPQPTRVYDPAGSLAATSVELSAGLINRQPGGVIARAGVQIPFFDLGNGNGLDANVSGGWLRARNNQAGVLDAAINFSTHNRLVDVAAGYSMLLNPSGGTTGPEALPGGVVRFGLNFNGERPTPEQVSPMGVRVFFEGRAYHNPDRALGVDDGVITLATANVGVNINPMPLVNGVQELWNRFMGSD